MRGVRWCNWEQLAGRKFDSSILLLGHGWWYRFKSYPHIPKNCNLRKFVSLSQKLHEWHTSGFEYQTCNRVHVETALIFITPAARHATDGRRLRRNMCVTQCDCNNCYKKKTCADCPYCFENKDVDCNKNGVQGCKYKIDYPIVREEKSDERM